MLLKIVASLVIVWGNYLFLKDKFLRQLKPKKDRLADNFFENISDDTLATLFDQTTMQEMTDSLMRTIENAEKLTQEMPGLNELVKKYDVPMILDKMQRAIKKSDYKQFAEVLFEAQLFMNEFGIFYFAELSRLKEKNHNSA